MILETSGKSYEENRSLNQDLSFESLQEEFYAQNMEFGPQQMKTLKLMGNDGLFTNLALLLSDQCPFTIKAAVFQGTDNAVFRDRKEFSGSLLKQLEDVYSYLNFYNKTEAVFDGLKRTDRRDYPEGAIREALLNCIVHRDYLFSGSTIINLFDDHIEFISLGGLVSGISMEAIFMGASQSRNPNLASVLYRLGLIESYGTGIRKIIRLYRGFEPQPVFRAAEDVFTVELSNRNENRSAESAHQKNGAGTEAGILSERMKEKVYQIAREKGEITRRDVEDALHAGSTKSYKLLKQLCKEGLIAQNKNGNRTSYSVL